MHEDQYFSKVLKAWADQVPSPPSHLRRKILFLAARPGIASLTKGSAAIHSSKVIPGDWTRLVSVWDSPLLYQFGFTGNRLVI